MQNYWKWKSENATEIDSLLEPIFIDFCTIWGPKSRPEIVQKSLKIGPVSYLGRKAELEMLQGANFDVFGEVRDQFSTIPGRFSDDFGAATFTNPCLEECTIQLLLRNQTSKNIL